MKWLVRQIGLVYSCKNDMKFTIIPNKVIWHIGLYEPNTIDWIPLWEERLSLVYKK